MHVITNAMTELTTVTSTVTVEWKAKKPKRKQMTNVFFIINVNSWFVFH